MSISVLWLNLIGFFILSVQNTNDLLVVDVGEITSLIFEDLPPVGVGAPHLHVSSLSRVVDFNRLVIVSSSNSS
jgi:hypothetical protein